MAVVRGNATATVPTLPPPRPRSPPEYPDLYGKRRVLAKVQMREREIGFLQDELKSMEGVEPASVSCKEVADFVTGNPDPLMPAAKKSRRSSHFWKWLWCGGLSSPSPSPWWSCFKISSVCSSCCCCFGCCNKKPECSSCGDQCCDCDCCRMPKCCCRCGGERCCKCPATDFRPKCSNCCCNLSSSPCCCIIFSCPKCGPKLKNRCPSCEITTSCCCCCCYPCYSCY